MTKVHKTLPRPKPNEVRVWFQGSTGSGKTMLHDLIFKVLKERGVKVRRRAFNGEFAVRMEDQIVDLTHQNIDDVLTLELDSWGELEKLQFQWEEAADA
jgi:predicted ATPase